MDPTKKRLKQNHKWNEFHAANINLHKMEDILTEFEMTPLDHIHKYQNTWRQYVKRMYTFRIPRALFYLSTEWEKITELTQDAWNILINRNSSYRDVTWSIMRLNQHSSFIYVYCSLKKHPTFYFCKNLVVFPACQ